MTIRIGKIFDGSTDIILGLSGYGALGSSIPSAGIDGAGWVFDSLSLPEDSNKEYLAVLDSALPGLSTTIYSDFEYNGSTASRNFTLFEDGSSVGTATLSFVISADAINSSVTGTGILNNIFSPQVPITSLVLGPSTISTSVSVDINLSSNVSGTGVLMSVVTTSQSSTIISEVSGIGLVTSSTAKVAKLASQVGGLGLVVSTVNTGSLIISSQVSGVGVLTTEFINSLGESNIVVIDITTNYPVSSTAQSLDQFVQGNMYNLKVQIIDSDTGAPRSLVGTSSLVYALSESKHKPLKVSKQLGSGIEIEDVANGILNISISDLDLMTLLEGAYYHEIKQVNQRNEPTLLMSRTAHIMSNLIKE